MTDSPGTNEGASESGATHNVHLTEPRWTHIALRVADIDATISWYEKYTPLRLIDKREDQHGFGAWLGMPGRTSNPFILVVAQFFPDKDPFADSPMATLGPFSHLGMELPHRDDVDAIAATAQADGCLAMAPRQMPAPIGYITMLSDPDGNTIEFSWDQAVYSTLTKRWDAAE